MSVGSEHRIDELRLGFPFLSSLPSQVEIDVEPLLDAQVNGSPLHVQGRLQPFSEGRRSAVDLRWQQIDVAQWLEAVAPLLPQKLPLELQQGQLDLDLKVAFESKEAPAPSLLQIAGGATLSKLQARVPAQGMQVAWDRLAVEGLDLRPFERQARVGTVTLHAPSAEVDLPTLLSAPQPAQADTAGPPAAQRAASAASAASAAAPAAWQWAVDRVVLEEGRVLMREPAWPMGQVIAPIRMTVTGLASAGDKPAGVQLSLADAQGAEVKLDGTVHAGDRRADLSAELSGLQPAPWLEPWQASLPVRLLDGRVSLKARAQVDANGWAVREGALQLADLRVEPLRPAAATGDRSADRLVVGRLAASDVAVQSASGKPLAARVGAVRVDGLDLKAVRDGEGLSAWLAKPAAASTAKVEADPGAVDGTAATAPTWQIDDLHCSNCAVALIDRSVRPATTLALTRADLRLRPLGSDPRQPIAFELASTTGRNGRLNAQGSARLEPLAVKGRVDATAVDLGLLQPYVASHLNIRLTSAKASADGELQVEGSAQQPVASARWQGRLALDDLRTLDSLNAAEFVRFKRLSLDGADLAWKPAGIEADLGIVTLNDFYGRLIVNSDARLNLRDVVKRNEAPAAAVSITTPGSQGASAAQAPAAASSPGPAEKAPAVRWRAIELAGGTIDFTDNFVRPNYSARLTRIGGEVSALAWNDPKPADVRISGQVDDSAPLEITGTMHPLGALLHTDITATARGIDMTRLSTYAGRYAGYGIEKGTLSAKLRYRIDNGKLQAENQLCLDQLVFGNKVDSPDALKLPVLLAVSLLKDRNGVIDVSLPVSGSLDDPEFSIGGVVWRVVVNLLTKAVTSPFSLLSRAVGGGGGQELSFVEFAPGRSALGEAVPGTLDTLAKAMTDRPALRLEITGRADPAIDTAGLKQAAVEQWMREAKARSTGEDVDDVRIEPGERDRWLEAAYKHADLEDKPRNLIGWQTTPPATEVQERLAQSVIVGPDQLRALANQRADRVKVYLARTLPSERLLVTASRIDATGLNDKGSPARVGFALR